MKKEKREEKAGEDEREREIWKMREGVRQREGHKP